MGSGKRNGTSSSTDLTRRQRGAFLSGYFVSLPLQNRLVIFPMWVFVHIWKSLVPERVALDWDDFTCHGEINQIVRIELCLDFLE